MKQHVLVIDDNTLLMRIISRILMANGYTVTTANSGDEAFSFLKLHRFDLALCDLHMDGKDGFAVLAACKAMQPKTKVILSSGDVVYETIDMAFKCGADSFLAKPFLASELLHQVSLCLGPEHQEILGEIDLPANALQFVGLEECFG